MKLKAVFLLIVLLSLGCQQQGNERLREKTGIEVDEANRKLDGRASLQQNHLETLFKFYQGVSGVYEGRMQQMQTAQSAAEVISAKTATASESEFYVQVQISPNLSIYPLPPIPSLEQASAQVDRLAFNIHFVPYSKSNPNHAAGCKFENVKANLEKGEILIFRESCHTSMRLRLAQFDSTAQAKMQSQLAEKKYDVLEKMLTAVSPSLISQSLRKGETDRVPALIGSADLSTRAGYYRVTLFRQEDAE